MRKKEEEGSDNEEDEDGSKDGEEDSAANYPAEMRSFLITGGTDGIGLFTAKMLARYAPEAKEVIDKRIIAIHGKNPKKIREAVNEIRKDANRDHF